jgi:hypothetical protein
MKAGSRPKGRLPALIVIIFQPPGIWRVAIPASPL